MRFVKRLCTFSRVSISFLSIGFHATVQYSKIGLTYVVLLYVDCGVDRQKGNFWLEGPKHNTYFSSQFKYHTRAIGRGVHRISDLSRRICENVTVWHISNRGRGPGPRDPLGQLCRWIQATYLVDCTESSRANDLSTTQLRLVAQSQICHVWTRIAWRQILHDMHAAGRHSIRLNDDQHITLRLVPDPHRSRLLLADGDTFSLTDRVIN